jgi:hypothetical protein
VVAVGLRPEPLRQAATVAQAVDTVATDASQHSLSVFADMGSSLVAVRIVRAYPSAGRASSVSSAKSSLTPASSTG